MATEYKKDESSSKVPLSEEFQSRVIDIMKGCSEEECDFMQDCCYKRMEEIRKAQRDEEPDEFSTADMPA